MTTTSPPSRRGLLDPRRKTERIDRLAELTAAPDGGRGASLWVEAWRRLRRNPSAIVGAVIAMMLQRYVIIVATAFGGAWTMLVGWLALESARPSGRPMMAADVWILYPMPAEAQRWMPIAWLVLGSIGTAVQLAVTGRKR